MPNGYKSQAPNFQGKRLPVYCWHGEQGRIPDLLCFFKGNSCYAVVFHGSILKRVVLFMENAQFGSG